MHNITAILFNVVVQKEKKKKGALLELKLVHDIRSRGTLQYGVVRSVPKPKGGGNIQTMG